MILGGFLFFGSIIVLVVWSVRRLADRRDDRTYHPKTPFDHLKDRYAHGEISKDEFDRIKRDLMA